MQEAPSNVILFQQILYLKVSVQPQRDQGGVVVQVLDNDWGDPG